MEAPQKNKALFDAIILAKKGDRRGFQKLFILYKEKVYRYFFYLFHNQNLAEEYTQETFLKVFQNIHNLDSPYAFNSWLFSIAIRLYFDYKKPKKNLLNDSHDEYMDEDYSKQDRDVVLKTTVQKILNTLTEEERNAILLIDLMENSYEEAAVLMKVSQTELNQRIRSARVKFIDFCERHKLEVTGIFTLPDKKVS